MARLNKPFYLRWRAEPKTGTHVYLRTPHYNALLELQAQLRTSLMMTTGAKNPAFTMANAIEMLIEECLSDKNQRLRDYIKFNGRMLSLIEGNEIDPNTIDVRKYE